MTSPFGNTLITDLERFSKSNPADDHERLGILSPNEDWMEYFFGFTDAPGKFGKPIFEAAHTTKEKMNVIRDLLATKTIYNEKTGYMQVTSGGYIYRPGFFLAPSVEEIKDAINKLSSKLKKGIPIGAIVVGKDAGANHVSSENLTVHQGASQFNALEMIDQFKTPFDGIHDYIKDKTQGPRVALACVPGTYVRNYYNVEQYGGQFNALEDLQISHLNGYLIWGANPEEIKDKIIARKNSIKIPCMLYTEVSGITIEGNKTKYHDTNKLAHQIYSSAAPINSYSNGGNKKDQIAISKVLLEAAYMGTIGMAILLHHFDSGRSDNVLSRPKVNLTFVGDGVFLNSIDDILDAMLIAFKYYSKYEFEVYIHDFLGNNLQLLNKRFGIVKYNNKLANLLPLNISGIITAAPGPSGVSLFSHRECGGSTLARRMLAEQIIPEPEPRVNPAPKSDWTSEWPTSEPPKITPIVSSTCAAQKRRYISEEESLKMNINILGYSVVTVPLPTGEILFYNPRPYQRLMLETYLKSSQSVVNFESQDVKAQIWKEPENAEIVF